MKKLIIIFLSLFTTFGCETFDNPKLKSDEDPEPAVKFVFYTTHTQKPSRANSALYIDSTDWEIVLDDSVCIGEYITIDTTVQYTAWDYNQLDNDGYFLNILVDSNLVIDDRFQIHELGVGHHEVKIKRYDDNQFESYGRYYPLISKFDIIPNDTTGLPDYIVRYFPEFKENIATGYLVPAIIDTIFVHDYYYSVFVQGHADSTAITHANEHALWHSNQNGLGTALNDQIDIVIPIPVCI